MTVCYHLQGIRKARRSLFLQNYGNNLQEYTVSQSHYTLLADAQNTKTFMDTDFEYLLKNCLKIVVCFKIHEGPTIPAYVGMLRKVVKHTDTAGIRIEALLKLLGVAVIYVPLILTFRNYTFCPQSVCMFCMYLRKKEHMISLNNTQQLVFIFITEASVYCAVRSGSLNKMDYVSFLKDLQMNK
jgi:hypothetical protein